MTQASSPQGPPNQTPRFAKTELWVQVTTGGKPYPPSFQDMFLDPMFIGMEIWAIDQPASFAALLPPSPPATTASGAAPAPAPPAATAAAPAVPSPPGAPGPGAGALGGGTERLEPGDYPWEPSGGRPHPGYDVLVLNDQTNWPNDQRAAARQAVEAGRGIVALHHALGDNQDWPWWHEEVTGGQLVLADRGAARRSTVSPVASMAVRPAGAHPILRHVSPFTVTNEHAYKGMWQSPKITPLLQTSQAGSDATVAWVGVHPTARVVCIQPGGSRETHRHPAYRMLVRNAILWAGRRLI
jgi:Trehalose utilisation